MRQRYVMCTIILMFSFIFIIFIIFIHPPTLQREQMHAGAMPNPCLAVREPARAQPQAQSTPSTPSTPSRRSEGDLNKSINTHKTHIEKDNIAGARERQYSGRGQARGGKRGSQRGRGQVGVAPWRRTSASHLGVAPWPQVVKRVKVAYVSSQ